MDAERAAMQGCLLAISHNEVSLSQGQVIRLHETQMSGLEMLQTTMMLQGLLLLLATGGYMYSVWQFYRIVNAERPEWVQKRGSLSFFYDGLPRISDPNVSMALLRTVFSSRVHQLSSPSAVVYAYWIRALLPVCLAMLAAILSAALLSTP